MVNRGKAYGFFDCRYSREAIEKEVPVIRESVNTPSELELSLIEGVDNLTGGQTLRPIIRDAQEAGMRYVFEATYPGASNRTTADELAVILNQAYNTPLYVQDEPFSAGIVYEENGQYLFRD